MSWSTLCTSSPLSRRRSESAATETWWHLERSIQFPAGVSHTILLLSLSACAPCEARDPAGEGSSKAREYGLDPAAAKDRGRPSSRTLQLKRRAPAARLLELPCAAGALAWPASRRGGGATIHSLAHQPAAGASLGGDSGRESGGETARSAHRRQNVSLPGADHRTWATVGGRELKAGGQQPRREWGH